MVAAVHLLEEAVALAERAGDDAGTAAAANILGLAHLAAHDPSAAVAVLRRALAFVPRSVRASDHAMIKANLALAYEQAGDSRRARLAALQAGAVVEAAAPVRAQAEEMLMRLPGQPSEDLMAVLDEEDRDEWVAAVREEVLRATELPTSERNVGPRLPRRCAGSTSDLTRTGADPSRRHPRATSGHLHHGRRGDRRRMRRPLR